MFMRTNYLIIIWAIFVCVLPVAALPTEEAVYTNEYGITFYPDYPPKVGEKTSLRLYTLKPAQRVSLYTDREEEIPLAYKDGFWWGAFQVPADYKPGGHFFTVWIKYPFAANTLKQSRPDLFSTLAQSFGYKKKAFSHF